jgi:hypothetical protein
LAWSFLFRRIQSRLYARFRAFTSGRWLYARFRAFTSGRWKYRDMYAR